MKTEILIAAALAACLTSTQARIGENVGELTKRYGAPYRTMKADGNAILVRYYRFNGFEIVVTAMNGRSQIESFTKADKSDIDSQEIIALMRANLGKTRCSPGGTVEHGTRLVYLCGDKVVCYNGVQRALTIALKSSLGDFNARMDAIEAADKKQKLSGF
jgi:hypothetical protein